MPHHDHHHHHRRHLLADPRDDYGGGEPWDPRAARQLGWLLALIGFVIIVLPFLWLALDSGAGFVGYRDGAGTYHAAFPLDEGQRREYQKEPPPGSLNRVIGPTSDGDWLLVAVLVVGVLLGAVGLIQVASVDRRSKHRRHRRHHRHRAPAEQDHRHGITPAKPESGNAAAPPNTSFTA
jgi:hypothetical protein